MTATLLAAMTVMVASASAQDVTLTPAYRATILDSVAAKVGAGYFDVERADYIRGQLASRAIRGGYDTITTGPALAAALTRDLRAWGRDRHLGLMFSPKPRSMPPAGAPSAAMIAERAEQASARNFGFHALERLTGNIGYLEIGRFEAAALAGSTLNAAMQFLANTDALIIDLRANGGGHADMVALMTSYFLAEQTRLLTLKRRNPKDDDQVWSASHLPGPRYLGKPIFILTSNRTFSGAEGLTYDLKHFAQATVVGEKTRGGANPGGIQQIDEHFAVAVPTARVEHAATGSNWDADGIAPDVAVAASEAKRTAHRYALQTLIGSKAASGRSRMWQEAMTELFPTAAR